MDSSSWALLRAVMSDVKPLIVDKAHSAAGGEINLTGLSKSEIHDLLCHHLCVDVISLKCDPNLNQNHNTNPYPNCNPSANRNRPLPQLEP
ncbi:MAG: hypothetical protein SGPRY_012410 [Prymnesium sp.]